MKCRCNNKSIYKMSTEKGKHKFFWMGYIREAQVGWWQKSCSLEDEGVK